jgi:hypothetical protein
MKTEYIRDSWEYQTVCGAKAASVAAARPARRS